MFEQVAAWVKQLDKPVRLWISDKQQAFVTCIAEVFAGVPHRYCLRDLAKPVLELAARLLPQRVLVGPVAPRPQHPVVRGPIDPLSRAQGPAP